MRQGRKNSGDANGQRVEVQALLPLRANTIKLLRTRSRTRRTVAVAGDSGAYPVPFLTDFYPITSHRN